MKASTDDCAHALLEVTPAIMRTIRTEMRSHRTPDLSIPQFRTLNFINGQNGPSLSDVAGHIGLTLPSMSKIVDGLVARKLITREIASSDRRRMTLALTPRGQTLLKAAHEATKDCLADKLRSLSPADRALVINALDALRPIFLHQQPNPQS
jgi:MarR family transcriptional regulator for hemolysin